MAQRKDGVRGSVTELFRFSAIKQRSRCQGGAAAPLRKGGRHAANMAVSRNRTCDGLQTWVTLSFTTPQFQFEAPHSLPLSRLRSLQNQTPVHPVVMNKWSLFKQAEPLVTCWCAGSSKWSFSSRDPLGGKITHSHRKTHSYTDSSNLWKCRELDPVLWKYCNDTMYSELVQQIKLEGEPESVDFGAEASVRRQHANLQTESNIKQFPLSSCKWS
ncbi:uncharacterized protein LOC122828577 [Gambusia affinis]|uniref:uncharacterized protein LOC122828577 n=1 Tax=Gambusia affinis TaxID=33528 RepID=UPI001CDBD00C|nr:uncharacterized protein LOC122828577 [Gambusia affinis]